MTADVVRVKILGVASGITAVVDDAAERLEHVEFTAAEAEREIQAFIDACATSDVAMSEKPEEPATIVCTIADTDKDEACRYCGYAGGPGHGKKR